MAENEKSRDNWMESLKKEYQTIAKDMKECLEYCVSALERRSYLQGYEACIKIFSSNGFAVEKKWREIMRKLFEKTIFRIKLWYMDHLWRMSGESCFSLFPPSFYYTHTKEEIKRIKKEEMDMIRRLLDEWN